MILFVFYSVDDVAIAEAVAEVESELQREKHSDQAGGVMVPAMIIAAMAVGLYFLKFRWMLWNDKLSPQLKFIRGSALIKSESVNSDIRCVH